MRTMFKYVHWRLWTEMKWVWNFYFIEKSVIFFSQAICNQKWLNYALILVTVKIMCYWSLCLQKGDIIWFCGPSWIRGPKECSEGWLVNWFCQPTAWYVYNHCLTSVILIWFYKHQRQCIQQEKGPRLLFYYNYCTDEHVRNKLHLLHTMFPFCLTLVR